MIFTKIMTGLCLLGAIVLTVYGLSFVIIDTIKTKRQLSKDDTAKKNQTKCIHTITDCEECISQAGCQCKDENLVKLRKEQ